MSNDDFLKLVRSHDLLYGFNHNPKVLSRGEETIRTILRATREIDQTDAIRIWNDEVFRKCTSFIRNAYWWDECKLNDLIRVKLSY